MAIGSVLAVIVSIAGAGALVSIAAIVGEEAGCAIKKRWASEWPENLLIILMVGVLCAFLFVVGYLAGSFLWLRFG